MKECVICGKPDTMTDSEGVTRHSLVYCELFGEPCCRECYDDYRARYDYRSQ